MNRMWRMVNCGGGSSNHSGYGFACTGRNFAVGWVEGRLVKPSKLKSLPPRNPTSSPLGFADPYRAGPSRAGLTYSI